MTDLMPELRVPEQWMDDALCAQIDPELFFPEKGGSTKPAKSICGACDVKAECLAYALDQQESFGIWGGKSAKERQKMARQGMTGDQVLEAAATARPKPAPPAVRPETLVRPVVGYEDELPPAREVAQSPVRTPAEPAKRPGAATSKWAIRRVWVALDPTGEMHGPFDDQPGAVAFIGERLRPVPKPKAAGKRRYRPFREAEERELERLWSQGLHDNAIAKAMDRAPALITNRRTRMGLVANPSRRAAS